MRFEDLGLLPHVRDSRVRRREKMLVDHQLARLLRIKILCPKVFRRHQRHVTAVAVLLRLRRIVKASRIPAGDTAQEKGIVMILTAEELLVLIQREREMDLVAGGAEFRSFVQWLQKGLFVKL